MRSAMTRRRLLGIGAVLGGTAAVGATAPTARAAGTRPATDEELWPTTIRLPNGYHTGGVATGLLPYAYFGSLAGGEIYRANLVTGKGRLISPDLGVGNSSSGMWLDPRGRLFICGAWSRQIRVVQTPNGKQIASYEVGDELTAVSHVTVTSEAAWFTDAFYPVMYQLPLGPSGELPPRSAVRTIPLTGEWEQAPSGDPSAFGICRTPDRRALLVTNAYADGGTLYRVDPATGEAHKLAVEGVKLPSANGVTMVGRTLYVAQVDGIDVLRVDDAGTRAKAIAKITDPRLDGPFAVAAYGSRVYVTNARWGVEPTPDEPYNALAFPLVGTGGSARR